jgi:hypothetical protein
MRGLQVLASGPCGPEEIIVSLAARETDGMPDLVPGQRLPSGFQTAGPSSPSLLKQCVLLDCESIEDDSLLLGGRSLVAFLAALRRSVSLRVT